MTNGSSSTSNACCKSGSPPRPHPPEGAARTDDCADRPRIELRPVDAVGAEVR